MRKNKKIAGFFIAILVFSIVVICLFLAAFVFNRSNSDNKEVKEYILDEKENLDIPVRTLLSISAKDFGIPVEYSTVYFNKGSEYMLYKTYEMEDYLATLEYLQKNYEILDITTTPISSTICYMITFKIKGDKNNELLFNNVESKESNTK